MSTSYTVNLTNQPLPSQVDKVPVIRDTIIAAGYWLNSYVKGLGTVDINVNFDSTIATMNAGSVSNQFIKSVTASNGKSYRVLQDSVPFEVLAGTDINGSQADAVINIGTKNLDNYYWFDPTLSTSADIPQNKTDGFRVILHELLHTIGFNGWLANASGSYTGSVYSPYDQYLTTSGGRTFFTGPNAQQAFGGPVPVTNAHLGDATSFAQGVLTGKSTLMSYDFVPNGSRLSLDPVVIGVLRDLGYTVRDTQATFVGQTGTTGTAVIGMASSGYKITKTLDLTWLSFTNRSDYSYLLGNEQRLQFTDANIALDTGAGAIGGQAYRLYQAAFNRAPDPGGIGYWINAMDNGATLKQVAQGFVDSPEFKLVYGQSPSNAQIVAKFYDNVLHRVGEASGFNSWVGGLDSKAVTVADVLAGFSESAENQAALVGVIGNGFAFTASA
jgi:hypothetical protein